MKHGADRKVRFKARYAAALASFLCTEETRYYLRGIFVHPHPTQPGVILVATDGHVLGVIHDVDGYANGEWICQIPTQIMSACRKKRKTGVRFKPDENAGHVHFIGHTGYVTAEALKDFHWNGGSLKDDSPMANDPSEITQFHLAIAYAPAIDGTYPAWPRVLPKDFGPFEILSVNSKYVSRFADAAKFLRESGPDIQHLIMIPTDLSSSRKDDSRGGDPIIVRIADTPHFLGVLMPMHDRDRFHQKTAERAFPEWVKEIASHRPPDKPPAEKPAEAPAAEVTA